MKFSLSSALALVALAAACSVSIDGIPTPEEPDADQGTQPRLDAAADAPMSKLDAAAPDLASDARPADATPDTVGACSSRTKALGQSCTCNGECASNFCADGVCCNQACTGACVSCNQAGQMGQCTPVPLDAPDPHDVCQANAASTCGQNGKCDGRGACAKHPPGTVCKPGTCTAGSQMGASTCDGKGTCVDGSAVNCYPYTCDSNSSLCRRNCTANNQCATGNVCTNPGANGSCGLKGNGQACGGHGECRSNFCVDGVCCESACTGACNYCAFQNSLGRCVAVPGGVVDPRRICTDQGASTCGTNGRCNGSGGCQRYGNGTICRAGTCSTQANAATGDSTCQNGQCVTPPPATCFPYKCSGNRCGTSCTADNQCVAPRVCSGTSCGRQPVGSTCTADDDCDSRHCEQGVCCGTACTASCYSCNIPGTIGQCRPVGAGGADPAGVCQDARLQSSMSCGTNGVCDGAGNCQRYPTGTVCGTSSCANGVTQPAPTCDGAGSCVPGQPQACTPYVCNATNTDCYKSCETSSQCIPARACENGQCGKKDNGAQCSDPDECKTGFCRDGYCCDTICNDTCKACNVAGRLGACWPVPNDAGDPTCPDETGTMTCGRTGKCNGAGVCKYVASGVICGAGACSGDLASVVTPLCNGAGACSSSSSVSCVDMLGFGCVGGSCATSCDPQTNAGCPAGKYCWGGKCNNTPQKNQGDACVPADGDCKTGLYCVDGRCCNSQCTETCKACNVAGSLGVCTNVPDGGVDSTCPNETGSMTCGRTGVCDGGGACKYTASGTACGATMCSNDLASVVTPTCNGSGACSGMSSVSCVAMQGYGCVGGACATSCNPSNHSGCAVGQYCWDDGRCHATPQKSQGEACVPANNECKSGLSCVDGVCCNSACTGTCMACNVAGSVGTCSPVPDGQGDSTCPNETGSNSCGQTGVCNGGGVCKHVASGTACGAPMCSIDLAHVVTPTCNGSGACSGTSSVSCVAMAGYGCSGGACATSCNPSDHSGCATGHYCWVADGKCHDDPEP